MSTKNTLDKDKYFDDEFKQHKIVLFCIGILGYIICLILAVCYRDNNFEVATVCVLSSVLFMQICLSNIKLNRPGLLWISAAFQGIPAIASILFVLYK